MNRVEIESAELNTRGGISKASGQPWTAREQSGWLYQGDSRHSERFVFDIADGALAYPPGDYMFADSSTVTDKYRRLSYDRYLKLLPIQKKVSA